MCLEEKSQECRSLSAVAGTEIPSSCQGCVGARDRNAGSCRSGLSYISRAAWGGLMAPAHILCACTRWMPRLPQLQDQQFYPSLLFSPSGESRRSPQGKHRSQRGPCHRAASCHQAGCPLQAGVLFCVAEDKEGSPLNQE